MPTITITTRSTKSGPRYHVRFRLGGRAYPIVHGGSFHTLRDAKTRHALISGEIAAGRNPTLLLNAIVAAPVPVRTFASYAEAYQASRVDIAATTAKILTSHLNAILPVFGNRDPQTITPADVQEWISGLTISPSSVRGYLATLRKVLDYADVDPNPARDDRVKLPRAKREVVDPPSAVEVETIVSTVPARWRLPLRVLEQTGLRVGELHALAWGDVDEDGSRFRIKNGKTASARRWVAVPDWLIAEVAATCPREDRTPERIVFPGANPDTLGRVMGQACKTAGIVHRHPHDLRHRFISVKIAEGVPVPIVSAQVGHSKQSMTLDVYSHVLVDD
jgi:integrase